MQAALAVDGTLAAEAVDRDDMVEDPVSSMGHKAVVEVAAVETQGCGGGGGRCRVGGAVMATAATEGSPEGRPSQLSVRRWPNRPAGTTGWKTHN